MKKIYNLKWLTVLLMIIITSCNDEDSDLTGKGLVRFNVSINNEVDEITRSGSEWNPAEDCIIKIYNQEGLIQRYEGVASLPSELWLVSGDYSVTVVAGDSVLAAFDERYYKGAANFTVSAGSQNTTDVKCQLANVLATVNFKEGLTQHFNSYEVSVFNVADKGELLFDEEKNGVTGYFMMPENVTSLGYSFSGMNTDGDPVIKTGIIEGVKPATNYILNFNYDNDYTDGGLIFDLEVIEVTEPTEDDRVVIYMPPAIILHGADISSPYYISNGSDDDIYLWISGSTEIKSAKFTVDAQTQTAFGLPVSQFDFLQMSDDGLANLEYAGFVYTNKSDAEEDEWRLLVTIEGNKIKEVESGDYRFTIYAEDENGKTKEAAFNLSITDMVAVTTDLDVSTVWARKATLTGSLIMPTSSDISFIYRKSTDAIWNEIPAEINDETLTADISGLEPGTTYMYKVKVGDLESPVTCTFTTEAAAQLPNSKFDDWHQPSSAWLIYEEGGSMFWDSGNHGSASYGTNVTTSDPTISHTGTSAKLSSEFVVLKFAAGNMFAGAYIKLDGTDGAILDFGRPFTSRPNKLTGWYKYTAGTINNVGSKLTDELKAEGAVSGAMDKAHVWVVLGDWSTTYPDDQKGPVRINSKNRPGGLYDYKTDPNAIAFGELVQHESTDGDGLKQFTIDLDYIHTDRKATHIIVVCSASKYGDYFTGSTGSTLWLDDFELIYE